MERFLTVKFVWNFIIGLLGRYPLPKSLGYLWNFGSLSGAFLVIQVLTGLFLAMFYTPYMEEAFTSVDHIMHNVLYGWVIRLLHLNSASFFFFCIYIHILRGLYYRSYTTPQTSAWITGITIYVLLMGAAFLGYVLPWGQMSYWAATVITNLLSVIPYIGHSAVVWIWGGFSINNATLKRFYCLHYLIPFIILALVLLHLLSLHQSGSSNFKRARVFKGYTSLFYPYFVVKDLFTLCLVIGFYGWICCFFPEVFNHSINYIEADPSLTPEHIVPEWYFLPFYAILRCVLQKEIGIIYMFLSIALFFLLPKISPKTGYEFVISTGYNQFFFIFTFNVLFLGYLGSQQLDYPIIELSLLCTWWYFFYFIYVLPIMVAINSYASGLSWEYKYSSNINYYRSISKKESMKIETINKKRIFKTLHK